MNRQMNRFGGNRFAAAAKYQAQAQQQQAPSGLSWLGNSLGLGGGQDLQSSQSQPYGSYSSGYGGGSPGGSCFSIDICPDLILAAIAAAAAAAAFGLYIAITQAGRRKKRSDGSVEEESYLDSFIRSWAPQFVGLSNLFHIGLEEFEEKIDKIAEGEDDGENSWISKIYNQFSFFNDGENSLDESDMDGLEPPLLDETWGLGVRTHNQGNVTAVERNATTGMMETFEETEEERCRVAMWRCLSRVVESGLHCMESEEGISGYAKKSMFKIVYHGGFSDPWAGLMAVPEAKQVKNCMAEHTECISMDILRREAEETLDPDDPMIEMYSKKRTAEENTKENEEEVKKLELNEKKDRVLINPEFVQGIDKGGGFLPYEEDSFDV